MEVATARRRTGRNAANGNSPLTGQPFLMNSAADFDDVTTFRQDYTALPLESCCRKTVEPLPPASVIHKNSCYLKLHGSLTQNTYKPPTSALSGKDIRLGSEGGDRSREEDDGSTKRMPNKMFATNFHLNADRRLDSHCTTNQEGFPPLVPEPHSIFHRFAALSHHKDGADSGPLGRRVFDPSAKSEYNSVFQSAKGEQGEATRVEGAKLPFLKTIEPRNTLTGTPGDSHSIAQSGQLVTTHKDTFKGEALSSDVTSSEMARRQRLRITCIPQGDPSKIAILRSNHQTSYNHPSQQCDELESGNSIGCRPPPTRQINQSSIKLKDHTQPASHYFTTTTTNTFQQPNAAVKTVPLIRFSRNVSFFPRGDLDPVRVKERLNHVTTRSAHPEPPAGSFPAHVNSCNFHTQSSVHLGWSKSWLQPEGTMATSYQPLSQVVHRARAPSTDNLPLHYCSGHLTKSTTADAYRSIDQGQRLNKIDKEAINNLKSSHWSLPNMGGSTYSTTHRECFTAPRQHAG